MAVVELPLIPPGRLAALLIARRSQRGLSVSDLARLSGGNFTASHLDAVERGAVRLNEHSTQTIVDLYELESGPVVPDRNQLVLDLDQRIVGVGDQSLSLPSTTERDILERYVSLLYLLRHEAPGKKLSLRDGDLEVLEHALSRGQSELASELFAIMGASDTEARTFLLGKRAMVLGAGLLVGASAMGVLVLVGSGDTYVPVNLDSSAASELVSARGENLTGTLATQVAPAARAAPASVATSAVSEIATAGLSRSTLAETAITQGTGAMTPEVTDSLTDEQVNASSSAASALLDSVLGVKQHPIVEAVLGTGGNDAAEATLIADPSSTDGVTVAAAASTSTQSAASPTQIGAAAEAIVSYDFRAALPGWTINYEGDLNGYRGLTNSRLQTVTVYVDPGASPYTVAEVLMHEVGHALDIEHMDNASRQQWITMRNLPNQWWAGEGLNDFAVGAGDFAEAVAAATVGSASQSHHGGFTSAQLDFVRSHLP